MHTHFEMDAKSTVTWDIIRTKMRDAHSHTVFNLICWSLYTQLHKKKMFNNFVKYLIKCVQNESTNTTRKFHQVDIMMYFRISDEYFMSNEFVAFSCGLSLLSFK